MTGSPVEVSAPLTVAAPLAGRAVPLAEVPDPVFAQQMVGSGFAVLPDASAGVFDVVAPISGTLAKLHPHAFVIVDPSGRGVLVHVGIDTVKLDGDGFTLLAAEGDVVEAGALIQRVDPAPAVAAGYSLASPVVALDTAADSAVVDAALAGSAQVAAGAPLFTVA